MTTPPINIDEKIASLILAGAVSVTWDIDWHNDESDVNEMAIEYFDGNVEVIKGLVGDTMDLELWHMVWYLGRDDYNLDGKFKLMLNPAKIELERIGETDHRRYDYDEYNDEDDFDGSTDRYNDEGGYW